MICPHCGKDATAIRGRCSVCHHELEAAAHAVTGLPSFNVDETVAGDVTVGLADGSAADVTVGFPPPNPVAPPPVPPTIPAHSGVSGDQDATILTSSHSTGTPARGMRAVPAGPLIPGEAFGRYHVIRQLGAGGMGAVYQAWDDELGVAVAIKVIKLEVMTDPEAGEELQRRFKRELLLARQVTHKNVVRIHDLGEIDGIKYITMPYVQGSDLASLIKRHGKLSVERTVSVARQIASGLAAAHEAGVVHRDLKPENIMIEGDLALIMDFGIARGGAGTDRTIAGAVRGTIGYMAPEQARGEVVDQRADIYAFGLIMYDMLLGRVRHARSGQNPVAELMERMQRAPQPARELDDNIPADLDRIVNRCIEPDPNARFQTTAELVDALNQLDTEGHVLSGSTTTARASTVAVETPAPPPPVPVRRPSTWTMLGIAAGAIVLIAGLVFVRPLFQGAAEPEPVAAPAPVAQQTLAILPFRNASGDEKLDWLGSAVAEILRSEIGQSANLRTISSERLQQLLTDLRIPAGSTLDPATLRRLAEFSNAHAVLWGQYLSFGNEIRIDATIEDLQGQRSIPLKAQSPSQAALVDVLGEFARTIRASLGRTDSADLSASNAKPSSRSLTALRAYNEGLSLRRQGKQSDALKKFDEATKEDAEFALAYARLAESYKTLGYDNEADQASRRASTLSDALPPREKFFILATHARILGDAPKAIGFYESLLEASPADLDTRFELARLYEDTAKLDEARDQLLRILKDDPKNVTTLLAAGRVEIRRREPQAALDYLNQALTLAVQFDNAEARGNILNATGIAYRLLNKTDEALRNYREALEIRRRLGQKSGVANSLTEIAQINVRMGQQAEALKNYNEALALQREIGDNQGIGNTLLNLGNLHQERGQYQEALRVYRESLQVQRTVGNKTYEALLLNNIGGVYFHQGQYEDARTYFERALTLREELKGASQIAQTLHNLAEVNLRVGQYDAALELLLRALQMDRTGGNKRDAAIRSYSVGTLFEYQGRYGASLSSREEAVKTFQELGDNSPLMVEMLAGHGNALNQVGRFEEGRKTLESALTRARALKNQALVGQVLNLLGDSYYFAGDLSTARSWFDQAAQAAAASSDQHLVLQTQVNQAKLDIHDRAATAASTLTRLVQQTEAQGLRYLSADASIHLGEALSNLKRYPAARQELQRAIARSERLGLRALVAKGHHALARVDTVEGKTADALRHQAEARRIVDEIYKEAATETIRKRTDLALVTSASR